VSLFASIQFYKEASSVMVINIISFDFYLMLADGCHKQIVLSMWLVHYGTYGVYVKCEQKGIKDKILGETTSYIYTITVDEVPEVVTLLLCLI